MPTPVTQEINFKQLMSPVSLLSPLSNPVLGFSTNLNSQMQAFSPKELTTYNTTTKYNNSTTHQ
jgi:hypothetical protein